ncbi:hypothetical protein [Streptomyces canus]|uniref:hypothetical protein n=1 Tax=Streptomyces canus TaxID=58343 RepID=UPI001319CBC9
MMDVDAYRPADPQAPEPMQPEPIQMGELALDAPALGAQAGTVLGTAADDQRLHTEVPDQHHTLHGLPVAFALT